MTPLARVGELVGTAAASGRPGPLGSDALIGPAGEFVRLIEPHTEADPAALLFQLLVGFGCLVGRGPFVEADGARHYANEYLTIVGESSRGRKGTAWGHVWKRLSAADEMLGVASGLSSGEGLIYNVRDPANDDPGVADKRLLVYESEFVSALRVMKRDGSTLSAKLRAGWDSGDLRVLTKNEPYKATGAHISLVGHVTKADLSKHLDQTETANGFANRILWTYASRSKFLPEGGRPVDFTQLDECLRAAARDGCREIELCRDPEARELWVSRYADLTRDRPGLFGSVTSRAEAHVLRLSLIYALLDRDTAIRHPHLEAALECWRYCEESAQFIFGDGTGDRVADRILQAVREKPGITKVEVHALFGNHEKQASIDRATEDLVRFELVRVESMSTGGRPAKKLWPRDTPLPSLSSHPTGPAPIGVPSLPSLNSQRAGEGGRP